MRRGTPPAGARERRTKGDEEEKKVTYLSRNLSCKAVETNPEL